MKQVLLINDIAGYGKVGMAAMLPVLSYMGIPAFCLPTALVSNTLDYGEFTQLDTTDYMRRTFPIWKHLGFHFDAISTGLMFNPEQAGLVEAYCREQAATGCTIFVDPVMGDGGRLYNGITLRQVELMRRMVSVAHLAKPNYTEACFLCGVPCRMEGITADEARKLLDSLRLLGARSAIITSCIIDGANMVCGYDANTGEYFFHEYEHIPGLFHGTGDIFSAVLIGGIMGQQMSLPLATRRAMDVVSKMISRNRDVEDRNCGIFIERCLDLLA
jgi:pyridoxine kinase